MNEDDDNTDNDWDEKSDLTRIEDLSEFLHEDDPDVEDRLKQASGWQDSDDQGPATGEDLSSLDELEDNDEEDDLEEDQEDEASPFSAGFDSSEDYENDDENEEEDELDSDAFASFEESAFETDESEDDEQDAFPSFEEYQDEDENEEENDFSGPPSLPDEFGAPEDEEGEEDIENENNEDAFSAFDGPTQPDFALPQEFLQEESEEDSEENEIEDENTDESPFASFENADSEYGNEAENENEDDDFLEENNELQNFSDSPAPELIAPIAVPAQAPVVRENFQELRDFGNAISYGLVKTGGNPPFTLILRNIKYSEDAEDIMILLREHGLINADNETITEQGLQNGHLLISQISEYSAIYLAHKLRRFDVQMRIGLSEQLHPSKSYSQENKGLVSKYNLRQDRREELELTKSMVEIEDIIITTTNTLDGYQILDYIKVITAHYMISELELQLLHEKSLSQNDEATDKSPKYAFEQFRKESSEGENLEEDPEVMQQYHLGLEDIYEELADDLRNQAFKLEANAIVALNYSISPILLPTLKSDKGEMHYKITCTGNAVWISDGP